MKGARVRHTWRPGALRCGVFFLVWMIMTGGYSADWLPGLFAAAFATWTSLVLSPPGAGGDRVRPRALLRLLAGFAWGSLVAGLDIARRAFSRDVRVAPGFVRYRPALPAGDTRNLFTSIASLMPGSLCVATDASDDLIVHCLDLTQPIAAQLAVDEGRLIAALGVGSGPARSAAAVVPSGPPGT